LWGSHQQHSGRNFEPEIQDGGIDFSILDQLQGLADITSATDGRRSGFNAGFANLHGDEWLIRHDEDRPPLLNILRPARGRSPERP